MVIHYSSGAKLCTEYVECVDVNGDMYLVDQNDIFTVPESIFLVDLQKEVGREHTEINKKRQS